MHAIPKSRGFTLIELMVTIVVAGILLSIAIPSFQNFIIDSRLNAAATELADAVRLARSEAIKRSRPIVLCKVAPAASETCVTSNNWGGWAIHDEQLTGSNKVVRFGEFNTYGNSLKLSSDLNNQKAWFGADGLARIGSGAGELIVEATLTICSTAGTGNKVRKVVFSGAGRLSIEREAGGCP